MKDRKLVFSVTAKDCDFDFYRGSGKGGQKRNKTDNCARCTHRVSGAVGKSENGRSQRKNKEAAFFKMSQTKEFKNWHKKQTNRLIGQEIDLEKQVDESMKHIKIEGKEDGKWEELDD